MMFSGRSFKQSGLPQSVILRNLPNNCTRGKLLDQVSEAGFAGLFDNFHMPLDQDTGANKGYAFFNFKDSSSAEIFRSVFHGKRLSGFKSRKVLALELSRVQFSAQEQCTSVIKDQQKIFRQDFVSDTRDFAEILAVISEQQKPVLNPAFIPAKISLSTLSALPRHFEERSKLIASSPVKVVISKLDSPKPCFCDEEYDEGCTPSVSDVDSMSDDESRLLDMMQIQKGMPVVMYTVSL